MSEQATFETGDWVYRPEFGARSLVGVVQQVDGWTVTVRWSGAGGWSEPVDARKLLAFPRAPARPLAPGVESRSDVQGGKPCLAGTRTPTDVVRGWHGWDIFHAAHPHVARPEYDRALLFEAGVAWERERRRRRKERRAVRRYERAKALAEAKEDDRG